MKYLFFDIECANCFNGQGKICSIGYVIVDGSFNIIQQKDILINPNSKFHLRNRASGEGIELGYDKQVFLNSPKFDSYYSFIKGLLESDEYTIFGHSVINDINFLIAECNRYKLPYFNFKAYDTQILHRHFMPESKENGLGKICESFGIEIENLHRSDYDAFLTMQVAKKICQNHSVSLDALLAECPNCYYSVENGNVVNHYSTTSYSKKLSNLAKFIKIDTRLKKQENVYEKYFGFSQDFEEKNYKKAMLLVKFIRWNGGFYTHKTNKMNYYLNFGKACQRSENIDKEKVVMLDENALIEMLGIDKKLYESVDSWSYSKIKNYALDLPKEIADIN